MPPLLERISSLWNPQPAAAAEAPAAPAASPNAPKNTTTLADRIYGLATGASVSRIENPNAGKFQRTTTFNDEEKNVILGTLFGEVSNRTPDKQRLEAQTILNTARNRAKAKGTSIIEELKRPNQYQAYKGKEYERFVRGELKDTDQQKVEAIQEIYRMLEEDKLEDNINGYQYYIHRPDGSIHATKEYLYGKNAQKQSPDGDLAQR